MKRLLCVLTLVLGSGCSSSTAPDSSSSLMPLSVTTRNGNLLLQNRSEHAAFYFTAERQSAALISWAQCVNTARCTTVAPGGQVAVPYSAISGYTPGSAEAIVWWWKAVQPGSGAARPGALHTVVVRL